MKLSEILPSSIEMRSSMRIIGRARGAGLVGGVSNDRPMYHMAFHIPKYACLTRSSASSSAPLPASVMRPFSST